MAKKQTGYVPPHDLAFTKPQQAAIALVTVICAKESLIYQDYLAAFPPPLCFAHRHSILHDRALAKWADGDVESHVVSAIRGTGVTAESLHHWARDYIAIIQWFKKFEILDPVGLMTYSGYVLPRENGRGVIPDFTKLAKLMETK